MTGGVPLQWRPRDPVSRLGGRARHAAGELRARLGARSPARHPSRPDFLGIGGQKCGTTWLDRMLRRHPSVAMADCKEMHYFDRALHRAPAAYFRHFPSDREVKRGEITPAYALLSTRRIAYVHRLLPDLRLVLLLRDPVERAWSQIRMNLADVPGRPLASLSLEEVTRAVDSPAVRRRSDYPGTIERWTAFFARDRLLIGYHRQIAEEPWALLERVFRHIGVAVPSDRRAFATDRRVLPVARRGGEADDAEPPGSVPERFRPLLEERLGDVRRRTVELLGDEATRWLGPATDDEGEFHAGA